MSGAVPCTGSNRPRFVSGVILPEGAMPIPPISSAVRSDRMSPKRLPVTMTSNCVGWRRQPGVVELGRAEVDVQVELEAQAQQHAREVGGVVEARVAHGAEEDGIGLLEVGPDLCRDRLPGAHVLVGVDLVLLEIEAGAGRAKDLDRLGDDLLARTVAGQDGDVARQGSLPSRAACSAGSCRSRSWAGRARTRSSAGTGSAGGATCSAPAARRQARRR